MTETAPEQLDRLRALDAQLAACDPWDSERLGTFLGEREGLIRTFARTDAPIDALVECRAAGEILRARLSQYRAVLVSRLQQVGKDRLLAESLGGSDRRGVDVEG